jgi:capsular polysaccharide transport system ATP-binding protein
MLEVIDVSKRYPVRDGFHTVLDRVSLAVAPGERIGILGRNGAGKSTLVRLIGGSETPDSGTIRRTMSVSWPLAFSGGMQPSLTGMDNLRFICRLYNVDPGPKTAFVRDFTELGKYLSEPVKSYSSGMRARLLFAISMAIDFDCYLIDELAGVGDDRFRERFHNELFEERKHKSLIIVSHSASYIRKHCHHAAVLRDGQLHCFGSVTDAFAFYSEA